MLKTIDYHLIVVTGSERVCLRREYTKISQENSTKDLGRLQNKKMSLVLEMIIDQFNKPFSHI